jgi:hypothetical protein
MDGRENIVQAIRTQKFERFLELLDDRFKRAARKAASESQALGLQVVDGRAAEALRRKPPKST